MRKRFEEDYQRLLKELQEAKRIHCFEFSSRTPRRVNSADRLVGMASKRLSVKQIKLLRQHRYILGKLASSDRKDRRKILENAPTELFKVLNMIFRLLADEHLDLSKHQDKKIKKHKRLIRSTSGLKGSRIKRKFTGQSGGTLATILSTVLPVIGGLIQAIL